MPYPFVPLLKSVLLVMPLLLGVQGAAMLVRSLQVIRGRA
jgi:TRAP-type mannitol/chloroaromatic compound transport system permease small subunit